MVAFQQLALASGIAFAGGLAGAAVATLLTRRALARAAERWAARLAEADVPAGFHAPVFAPLREAISSALEAERRALDEVDAQRRQLSADMVQVMNQSDGAIRAKDRFLASISHDLRQPLQSMDLALEQLRSDALPAHPRELAQLQAGMHTLTEVLDGLLLVSQLDAGTLQAQAAPCDLQEIFAEVLATHDDAARSANVSLHAHAGGHAVFTDAGMLGSLLARLLDNAIKASRPGGRVLLGARRHAGGIRIEVRDGGIGIAPIHQPRVFDEFFQVGNPERDQRKGFGLGLAIVSRLAALLGTRVELRSRLHAGSCFWLVLPRASVLQRPPRAVVLDRDPEQRLALAAMLKSWGYAVSAESDVDAACARVRGTNGNVDAVLAAVDAGDDPAWNLLQAAASKQAHAARIALCTSPDAGVLERAAQFGTQIMSRPPAPAKLRSLLGKRQPHPLRGAA